MVLDDVEVEGMDASVRKSRIDGFVRAVQSRCISQKKLAAQEIHMHEPKGDLRPSFAEVQAQSAESWRPFALGASVGPIWSTKWFRVHFSGVVPPEDGEELVFLWDSASEAMVYSAEGYPLEMLLGGNGHDRREKVVIPSLWVQSDGSLTIHVEMVCTGMFGNGVGWRCGPDPPDESRTFCVSVCALGVIHSEWVALHADLDVLGRLARRTGTHDPAAARALQAFSRIMRLLDPEVDASSQSSRAQNMEKVREITRNVLRTAGLTNKRETTDFQVLALGHCHIDTMWLWPTGETRRKTMRSWATQLRYMEQKPWYRFACSQMQQYDWLKEDYPALFARIVEKSRGPNAQWIPVGGTWVEMDGNLPSGESFVRQFLYGQRFLQREFGRCSSVFWLPDTFGYAAQLPQICAQAGIRGFVTQKLSWNQTNKWPRSTFRWVGLDGTALLTHFPPADTYTATVTLTEVANSRDRFHDHAHVGLQSAESLLLFGHGDGGGGPTLEMLERLERCADLPNLPRIYAGHPEDFFTRLAQDAANATTESSPPLVPGLDSFDGLQSWHGELYFEYHRGTYTTQAEMKRLNRRCEEALRRLEWLAVHSVVHLGSDPLAKSSGDKMEDSVTRRPLTAQQTQFPSFESEWRILMLNQFHDALPGSSIAAVYDQGVSQLSALLSTLETAIRETLRNFAAAIPRSGPEVWVHRSAAHPITRTILEIPVQDEGSGGGQFKDCVQLYHRPFEEHSSPIQLIATSLEAGLTIRPLSSGVERPVTVETRLSAEYGPLVIFANAYASYEIDRAGRIRSARLMQPTPREFVTATEPANQFVLHDDHPLSWDAWDVDQYHLEHGILLGDEHLHTSLHITSSGPLRVEACFEMRVGSASLLRQAISLDATDALLRFSTRVHWHEAHRFLKVQFPVRVRSAQARYDVPYGELDRPTHRNTSWDAAKFEVCGHRFADLVDASGGVALLSDSKYGYAVLGHVLRLSLLRAPKAPDPLADMGDHHFFSYGVLPHHTSQPDMVRKVAHDFCDRPWVQWVQNLDCNNITSPPTSVPASPLYLSPPTSAAVAIEAVKWAEDGSGELVVRLVERSGSFVRTSVCSSYAPSGLLQCCNLLEEALPDGSVGLGEDFELKPFEIRSFRLRI